VTITLITLIALITLITLMRGPETAGRGCGPEIFEVYFINKQTKKNKGNHKHIDKMSVK
jgi:hypothetical protein